jgi:hypothetical protein
MRIQAFQILAIRATHVSNQYMFCMLLAVIVFVALADKANAIGTQQGQCMIHREYKNDKRVMQYFSQDVIQDSDAGLSKESCERACRQRGQFLPENHAPHLRDATNMFFACQYNTMKQDGTEYGAVFNATAKIADLTLQKAEVVKKKSTGRGGAAGARTKRSFEKEASSVPPAQTPSAAVDATQKPKIVDRYAPLEPATTDAPEDADAAPVTAPAARRVPESFERKRREIRDPRY